MKRFIQIIAVFLVTVLFAQCNGFLDIEPESSIPPTIYWQSKDDAKSWMAGIYNQMQKTLRYNWFDWGEVRADNVTSAGTGTAQTVMLNNQLGSTNINSATNWEDLYTTVSFCNYGIKYLAQMIEEDIDAGSSDYKDYMGQCYGMRALMYFYGLRTWGRIPVITEAYESSSQLPVYPRFSIKAVRTQITRDIRMALKLINNNDDSKFYLNRSSMYALLTDLHAWFQEYDRVVEVSDTFLINTTTGWISDPAQWKYIFTEPGSSSENIFVMYWDNLESGNGMGYGSRLGSSGNTSNYKMREELYQRLFERYKPLAIDSSDFRYWACFDTVQCKDQAGYAENGGKFGKCVPWDPTVVTSAGKGAFKYSAANQNNVNMPIYRYADIMTLRAEAKAMTGKYDEALSILQKVRSRVGYTPTQEEDPTNYMDYYDDLAALGTDKGEALREAILNERQLEFMGEGKRWFDLCRIGKTIFSKPYYDESGLPPYMIKDDCYTYLRSIMNSSSLGRQDYTDFEGDNLGRILFPITSGAITANIFLRGDQNPPYDE